MAKDSKNTKDTMSTPASGTPSGAQNPASGAQPPAAPKAKGRPGRKTPMTQAEKDNMAKARTAAAAERNTLLAELMGEQAEKPSLWERLGKDAPNRLLAIRKIVDGVAKEALKSRLAAAEAEVAKIKAETERALAEINGPTAPAPQA